MSNTMEHPSDHRPDHDQAALAGTAEGRAAMTRTSGSFRPDHLDQTVNGGAGYEFVTAVLADRYAEAERARLATTPGASVRTRVGRGIVALGQAIGGRALVRTIPEEGPAAIAAAGRRGTAEGC